MWNVDTDYGWLLGHCGRFLKNRQRFEVMYVKCIRSKSRWIIWRRWGGRDWWCSFLRGEASLEKGFSQSKAAAAWRPADAKFSWCKQKTEDYLWKRCHLNLWVMLWLISFFTVYFLILMSMILFQLSECRARQNFRWLFFFLLIHDSWC